MNLPAKKIYGVNTTREFVLRQPWAGKDLSLKINEHDQTIWKNVFEFYSFHSIWMKLKLACSLFQKSTTWCWVCPKRCQIKTPTFYGVQLWLYTHCWDFISSFTSQTGLVLFKSSATSFFYNSKTVGCRRQKFRT